MRTGLWGASAMLAIAWPQMLLAQDAPEEASEAATDTRDDRTGDIIVRAQRRDQTLQSVPLSVTAVSQEQIQTEFPRNLADFTKFSPNVTIEPVGSVSRGSAVIFTRGVGYSGIDNIEPPVAVSIDGLFYSVNVGTLLNTYDVEQIEILKGPQGTLFGRNATAGVVQIRTKDPEPEFGVSGLIRTGSFGRFDTNVTVNVPVTDTLAIRVSGNTLHSDGAYVNTYAGPSGTEAPHRTGGDSSHAVRGKILWTPTEAISAKLTGWYTKQDQDAGVGQNVSGPGERLFTRGRPGLGQPGGPTSPYVVSRDEDGIDYIEQTGVIGDLAFDTGAGFEISTITGYLKTHSRQLTDFDASDLNFFHTDGRSMRSQFSQEIRFASTNSESPFQWQAGGIYFQTKWQTRQVNILGPSFAAQTTATSPVTLQYLGANTEAKSIGIFAQADLRLAEKLVLTAGGRYTNENKNIRVYPVLTGFDTPLPIPLYNEREWNDFIYHLSARYEFTDDIMAYVSYSTGTKAGGFSSNATTQAQLDPFKPETAKSWEAGLRTALFNKMLRFNITGFLVDYSDLQVTAFRPANNASGQQSFAANSAFERAKGIEIEATLNPVRGLRLSASLGLLDAKYTSFIAALSYSFPGRVCNGLTGGPGSPPIEQNHADPNSPCFLEPQRTPDVTLRLDAAYDIDLGSAGTLTPHVSYSFEDAHYTNLTNAPQGFQPAYSKLNADITYRDPDGRFRVSLFGKNLTDTTHLINANPIAGLFTVNYYTEPRIWGLELGFDF